LRVTAQPAQPAPQPQAPALVVFDAGDLAPWQSAAAERGWRLIAPAMAADTNIDARVQTVEKAVLEAIQSGSVDPARIWLAGRGEAVAAVFYTISRVPDLWAAAALVGGSPQPAIDSGRLYAANFTNVPVLWISDGANDPNTAGQLQSAGIPLERQAAARATMGMILDWLGGHSRAAHPASIDCETNAPVFARCYWIQMTKFDAAERNDVLASTRMAPELKPSLDLGNFGIKADDPGPGVLVTYLPDKYSGQLKLGDRLISLDGREIADGRRYVELMAQMVEERPAAVLVQRGKERIRIETRILVPKRPPGVTARVQAQYTPQDKQLLIISRTVTEMRVTIPAEWVPAELNWNGVVLETVGAPGCRLLTVEKAIQKSRPCP
jgi:predicted esterase